MKIATDIIRSRTEKDVIGAVEIPGNALYGINTVRGAQNFPFTSDTLGKRREFVRAFAFVKWAAALANDELEKITTRQRDAIVAACQEMAAGGLDDHLIIDLLEGSGGTSTNMNVNEVLANRAQQLLGGDLGDYSQVHPNDHVNLSQSTNDVYPSALKIAVHSLLPPLAKEIDLLSKALSEKAEQFSEVLHLGRTCLQDAQPMRLGQVFEGYASLAHRLCRSITKINDALIELPLGGTAIGTGFGSPPGYKTVLYKYLRQITGVNFEPAGNPFDAMQNLDVFARVSGELKTAAVSFAKIASDFILLSSGPAGGLNELYLPAIQAGSSIMPGKVNPVIPMSLCQVAHVVVGNDACITQAVQSGQLEINHFEPVVASRIFESISLLHAALRVFRQNCVEGIQANISVNERNLLCSSAISTSLIPKIGYAAASAIVRESYAAGEAVNLRLTRLNILSQDEIISLARTTSVVQKS